MTIAAFAVGLLIGTIVGIALVSILQMGRFEDDEDFDDPEYPKNEQMEMFK